MAVVEDETARGEFVGTGDVVVDDDVVDWVGVVVVDTTGELVVVVEEANQKAVEAAILFKDGHHIEIAFVCRMLYGVLFSIGSWTPRFIRRQNFFSTADEEEEERKGESSTKLTF